MLFCFDIQVQNLSQTTGFIYSIKFQIESFMPAEHVSIQQSIDLILESKPWQFQTF